MIKYNNCIIRPWCCHECMQKYCDNTNKLTENSMNMIVVWYEIYGKNIRATIQIK